MVDVKALNAIIKAKAKTCRTICKWLKNKGHNELANELGEKWSLEEITTIVEDKFDD